MRATRYAVLLLVLAGSAGAQKVQLELRPKTGDTLRMRLDQSIEINGTRQGKTPILVANTVTMYSRAIVEDETATGVRILAITDSVVVKTNDERGREMGDEMRRQLVGRQMRLRLTPDGTVELDEARRVPADVNDMIDVMPASFPRAPVAVGDTWSREMPIPRNTQFGVPLGGLVRARFRLDSLSSGGGLAYVSMRGTLQAPAGGADAGSVTGSMVMDRRRGWLSESRFLVQMRAVVQAPGAAAASPTHFRVKVTQHMRIAPARLP